MNFPIPQITPPTNTTKLYTVASASSVLASSAAGIGPRDFSPIAPIPSPSPSSSRPSSRIGSGSYNSTTAPPWPPSAVAPFVASSAALTRDQEDTFDYDSLLDDSSAPPVMVTEAQEAVKHHLHQQQQQHFSRPSSQQHLHHRHQDIAQISPSNTAVSNIPLRSPRPDFPIHVSDDQLFGADGGSTVTKTFTPTYSPANAQRGSGTDALPTSQRQSSGTYSTPIPQRQRSPEVMNYSPATPSPKTGTPTNSSSPGHVSWPGSVDSSNVSAHSSTPPPSVAKISFGASHHLELLKQARSAQFSNFLNEFGLGDIRIEDATEESANHNTHSPTSRDTDTPPSSDASDSPVSDTSATIPSVSVGSGHIPTQRKVVKARSPVQSPNTTILGATGRQLGSQRSFLDISHRAVRIATKRFLALSLFGKTVAIILALVLIYLSYTSLTSRTLTASTVQVNVAPAISAAATTAQERQREREQRQMNGRLAAARREKERGGSGWLSWLSFGLIGSSTLESADTTTVAQMDADDDPLLLQSLYYVYAANHIHDDVGSQEEKVFDEFGHKEKIPATLNQHPHQLLSQHQRTSESPFPPTPDRQWSLRLPSHRTGGIATDATALVGLRKVKNGKREKVLQPPPNGMPSHVALLLHELDDPTPSHRLTLDVVLDDEPDFLIQQQHPVTRPGSVPDSEKIQPHSILSSIDSALDSASVPLSQHDLQQQRLLELQQALRFDESKQDIEDAQAKQLLEEKKKEQQEEQKRRDALQVDLLRPNQKTAVEDETRIAKQRAAAALAKQRAIEQAEALRKKRSETSVELEGPTHVASNTVPSAGTSAAQAIVSPTKEWPSLETMMLLAKNQEVQQSKEQPEQRKPVNQVKQPLREVAAQLRGVAPSPTHIDVRPHSDVSARESKRLQRAKEDAAIAEARRLEDAAEANLPTTSHQHTPTATSYDNGIDQHEDAQKLEFDTYALVNQALARNAIQEKGKGKSKGKDQKEIDSAKNKQEKPAKPKDAVSSNKASKKAASETNSIKQVRGANGTKPKSNLKNVD